MNWFVLCVKSRSEKKVVQRIKNKGFAVFFPTKLEKRIWSDRIKEVEVPFFNSYVFVQFAEQDAVDVLDTPGVVRRLYWLGKAATIRPKEMQEVIDFFASHKNKAIECATFIPGEEVEIKSGKLKNRKAVVIKNDQNNVMLRLPALGFSFKVILPKNLISKIE